MPTEAQIYEFEIAIPRIVQTVFEAGDIIAWTAADDPALQRERPRVELVFQVGPATDHLQTVTLDTVTGCLVHDSYTGVLMISAYTKADYAEHIAYLAKIRAVASRLIYMETLDFHEIYAVTPAGTTAAIQPEEGVYEARLQYNLGFCVKHDQWPET